MSNKSDYQNSQKPLQNQEEIQFGISYISSLLKSKGHNCSLFIITSQTKEVDLEEAYSSCNPNLICFTSVSSEYDLTLKSAHYFKSKHPTTFLIIGGPHATLNGDKVINDFDAVCIGEGEYPMLELVELLESGKFPSKISNLWIKNNGNIEKNPTRNFVEDLDSLPFPDREMWQKFISFPNTRIPLLIGRGCPFQCSYCSNHALRKVAEGNYVRFRSVSNIIEELKETMRLFHWVEEIYFEVETFAANQEFAIDFCEKLNIFNETLPKKLKFGVNIRIMPKMNYAPLFQAMQNANFDQINVGLESGSEKIRTKILRRYHSNEDFTNFVKLAKSYGIKVYVNIIIGFPEETPTDFQQTIQCCRECQPEWIFPYIFYPYPGTDLYRLCEEKGYLKNQIKCVGERKKATLDLPTFSREEIQHQANWCYYNVYKSHRSLATLLGITTYRIISSYNSLNKVYRYVTSYPLFKKIETAGIKSITNKKDKC